MSGKKNVLPSLVDYSEDSEPESDSEAGVEAAGRVTGAEKKGGLVFEAYRHDFTPLERDQDGYREGDEEHIGHSEGTDSKTKKTQADAPKEFSDLEKRDPQELLASLLDSIRNLSPDEINIPPEPPGKCSRHLQDKIEKLYELKIKEKMDLNYIIQRKKEFRNPQIYEKLINYCSIDEFGTNYPKDIFDPSGWSEHSYYEALAKAQNIEMDKLLKATKERTKFEVERGAGEVTASTGAPAAQKRKGKWDCAIPGTRAAQPTILSPTTPLPAIVTVTSSASGSKTAVISAEGSIVKKAKHC